MVVGMTLGCSDNYIHGHGKSGVAYWVTHVTSHVCIPMGTATTSPLSISATTKYKDWSE